jgi:phage shock protein C
MRLRRSEDKIIAGVCGGLAEYFRMDPTVVRILYVLISLLSAAFPGLLVYLLLWLILPPPEKVAPYDRDVAP